MKKKKKILNVRKSLIAGAIVLATTLGGLGLLNLDRNNTPDPSTSEDPSSSQTIIQDEHGNKYELPGGVEIDPSIIDDNTNDNDNNISETPGETSGQENHENEENQNQTETPGSTIVTPGEETNANNQEAGSQEIGSTGTGTGTSTTEIPTETITNEPPIEEHTHTLGEWVSVNDLIEARYCPEDGTLMRIRMHCYRVTDKDVVTNNNGTHNTTLSLTCNHCGHTATLTRSNVKCTDNTLVWDDTNEYEVCNSCGYKATIGTHKYGKGTIKNNEITYTCENDGCGYSYTKPYNPGHSHTGGSGSNRPSHTHTYGSWVSLNDSLEANYCPTDGTLMGTRAHSYGESNTKTVSNNNGTHNTTTSAVCDTCGHAKTTTAENISCTFDNGVVNADQTKITYTCTECGYEKILDYTPGQEHTHNWSDWTVTKQPTCTTLGEETRTCTVEGCTIKTETRTISALGHSYGEWTVSQDWHVVTKEDGTQVEERTLEQVCSTCGNKNTKTEERPYSAEHTHNWSNWTVTKEATCTEAGVETRTCTVDGCTVKTETRTISALGHDMGEFIVTKQPTCTELGEETSTCSRGCGHTETKEINALGHSYGEWTVSQDWHVVTKEDGTQVEEQTLERECSVCHIKETKTEERPYTPEHSHNWSEWTVTKKATCTEDGVKTRTCTEDGCTIKTETEVIPALGHKEGTMNPSTGEVHCTRCGELLRVELVEDEEIWSEWTVTKKATCTEAGEETRTCTVNGVVTKTETQATSALGHKEGSMNPSTGEIHCTRCGELLGVELIEDDEIIEDNVLNTIIENQEQAKANASANAEQQLNNLINSDASDTEIDEALNQIINNQDQEIRDAAAQADTELDTAISNIEDAKVEQIISKQDQIIEEARQNAEVQLEQVISSSADEATKDAAIDQIIEETDRIIGEATAEADAALAALAGVTPEAPAIRELTK